MWMYIISGQYITFSLVFWDPIVFRTSTLNFVKGHLATTLKNCNNLKAWEYFYYTVSRNQPRRSKRSIMPSCLISHQFLCLLGWAELLTNIYYITILKYSVGSHYQVVYGARYSTVANSSKGCFNRILIILL